MRKSLDGTADILAGLNGSLGYFYQEEDGLPTDSVLLATGTPVTKNLQIFETEEEDGKVFVRTLIA